MGADVLSVPVFYGEIMKYTILTLLLSAFIFTAAGCNSSNEAVQTESPTEAATTPVTTATAPTTQQTTTAATITTTVATTETAIGYTEREILISFYTETFGNLMEDYIIFDGTQHITYKNEADYLMHNAEPYSDSPYGQVTCEEDVIKIAREIFTEERGESFVELIESEYIEMDGELVKYERNVPPYTVEYYDEYDVWYINPNAPSGVTEDGIKFGTPSMPPYLIIRGEDGKILGALI